MLRVPTLPECTEDGDHTLIRCVKLVHSFQWKCLVCYHTYTIYRLINSFMVYERTEPDAEGKFTEWNVR